MTQHMTPHRIYILNGHPAETSLSRRFAETYAEAAEAAGHEVRLTHLHDLSFDPDFGYGGYSQTKPLEPALETVLEDLTWSQHLVLLAPMWWGSLPAKLKGLLDRALLPGRAFDPRHRKNGFPAPMLSGRTARVIVTSDTPSWFLRLFYNNAMLMQIGTQILGFIGIKPTRFTLFATASHPKPGRVDHWISEIRKLGARAA